ncbi:hypothetical protein AB0D08_13095 [Kitasatospora sp. NPDC048540]|uniref:hypothetical protein n=1 Tax=Kitasatospora sp. NPDC048540 TaxID=3155634 RepID=UPI0033F1FADD
MADNENTATAPEISEPHPANAPAEHTLQAEDAQPLLEVLDALGEDEPAAEPEPAPVAVKSKPGEVFEPLGSITNHP